MLANDATNKIIVNEVFGPTIQGEGDMLGMPCYFLRLTGCNQHCFWCDTPYTWRFTSTNPHRDNKVYIKSEESTITNADDLCEYFIEKDKDVQIRNLIISGGEPMLQQKALAPLIYKLSKLGWFIWIETAGTIAPDLSLEGMDMVIGYSVSIKLENSQNPRELSIVPSAIKAFVDSGNVCWKFVVETVDDLAEIRDLVNKHSIPERRVYIMPEGISNDKISSRLRSAELVKEVIASRFNLTTRLQIVLYGNKRGV